MFISCPAILSSFCKHLKPILTRLFTNVFGYLLFTTQSLIDIYLYRSIRKIGHFRGNKIRQPRSVSKLVSSCLVLLFGLISFCFIRLLIGFQNFGQHNWKTSIRRKLTCYPMVCWVSRLNRKHEVKSLIFSTQNWWSALTSSSRSPDIRKLSHCSLRNKRSFEQKILQVINLLPSFKNIPGLILIFIGQKRFCKGQHTNTFIKQIHVCIYVFILIHGVHK